MTDIKYRLHIAESAMLIALSITLCLALWGQKNQASLAENLVRLHVIAHSDEEHEQELKLQVRDAVLSYTQPLLKDAKTAELAEKILATHMDGIKSAALSASEGRDVHVTLTREHYPTRFYGDFALPAGEYASLRILLGSAQGQNWWCVIFPPLCASASADAAQTLSKHDNSLITQDTAGYILRFRCAELWDELRTVADGALKP